MERLSLNKWPHPRVKKSFLVFLPIPSHSESLKLMNQCWFWQHIPIRIRAMKKVSFCSEYWFEKRFLKSVKFRFVPICLSCIFNSSKGSLWWKPLYAAYLSFTVQLLVHIQIIHHLIRNKMKYRNWNSPFLVQKNRNYYSHGSHSIKDILEDILREAKKNGALVAGPLRKELFFAASTETPKIVRWEGTVTMSAKVLPSPTSRS